MQQAWDKNGRIYYIDDNGNRVQPKTTKNAFERLGMQAKAGLGNLNRWLQNADTNSQSYKDKANLTLGLLTAPIGGSSVLASKGAAALTPMVGKKIAQSVASNAVGGATGGAVEGFGRGLIEGKNPLQTMLQDSAIGLVGGSAVGGAFGKIGQAFAKRGLPNNPLAQQQYFADYVEGLSNNTPLGQVSRFDKEFGKFKGLRDGYTPVNKQSQIMFDSPDDFVENMKNFDISNYSKDEYKQLRKQAKTFYKNNLSPKTASVGDVNVLFTDLGLDEQLSKGLHNVDVFTDLINQIETGNLHPELVNNKPNDERLFHIVNNKFKDKNMEYQLLNDKNVDKFYFAKDITNKKELPQIGRNQNTTYEEVPTNSITNNLDNFNPAAGLYEKIVDNNEVFYTPWNTEIIKNATSNQKQDLIREYRKQALNNLKGDDPVFRTTYDKDGNEYIWKAADDVHYNIENYLLDKLGIQANQNVYDLNRDILKQYRNNPEEYYNLSKKLRDYENDVMFGRFRGSFENYKN